MTTATLPDQVDGFFPYEHTTDGPVTAARKRRSLLVYTAMCALGLVPVVFGAGPAWQAAGLGLWFPGAGFLAVGGWAMLGAPLALALFAVALFAWFASGMVIAPIGVWLGAAVAAGAVADGAITPVSPYLVVALVAAVAACAPRTSAARKGNQRAQLQDRLQYLPAACAQVTERAEPAPSPDARELSPDDLAAARYALDRALQPIGQLGGFDRIEQFQTAALRYQINHLGYALAELQTHYTPSFHGYLSQAQRNLIEQYLERPVWSYWLYESAWGHLNVRNPDPAATDNIMLTGWFGLQVGLYTSASGDRRYTVPASLTFRRNARRAWQHDYHSLERSVVENFERSAFCLYPCEPNWIYPICNHYGMTSVVVHDRLSGTSDAGRHLGRWLASLDREFTDDSGSVIGLRSQLTGFRFPFPASEANFADFTNCFAPERARRMWAIARHDVEKILARDASGRPRIALPGRGFDFGNYRAGWGLVYAMFVAAAREFGDIEIADAAQRSLDEDAGRTDDGGVLRYLGMSNLANIVAFRGRIRRRDDFRHAVTQGPPASVARGPILADASYPEVLVARAFSRGDDLELVLYPGTRPGPQTIRIERLRPGAHYALRGTDRFFRADPQGVASLDVELRGRTPLAVALHDPA